MLIDKISRELYGNYIETAEMVLLQDSTYKDAAQCVNNALKEVKKLIPQDKAKLILELESSINTRDNLFAREAYVYAFGQGAKVMMEIAMDKYTENIKIK